MNLLRKWCAEYMEHYDVTDVYIQYVQNGKFYNIVDPNENLLCIGSIEELPKEFEGYKDNEYIPPTVYHSSRGWLCTTCEPIVSRKDGKVLGLACVDINMNALMAERNSFLMNSLIFVLAEIVVAIVISMLLMRRSVTHPLNLLAKAAKNFASGDNALTREDVIQFPIRSNDEIGDLYHEIQSMQTRIVDYTENITRITAEKERVSTELNLAAQIQLSALPGVFPAFPDHTEFDIYAGMDTAKEVGGDFYDFFLVDDDHLGMVMADVSGKGVPAALFMMASKIIISNNAMMGKSPSQVLRDTNTALCANGQTDMFVTVWIGILELSTGKLTAANGGHEYPVLKKGDWFEVYRDVHGFLVGGMPGMQYRDYEIRLQPGDKLFIYTDGLPEAQDAERKMFSLERLVETLNLNREESPEDLLKAVRTAVDAFAGNAEQFDDLTMLCLEYKGMNQSQDPPGV